MTSSPPQNLPSWASVSRHLRMPSVAGLLAILILVGVVRIVATWRVYSPTFDESAHLAAGMEWLDRGVYRYEEMHTPLARVAIAIGPYLDGLRSTGQHGIWNEGNAILNQRGEPRRALTLARLGILPFFVFTSLLVFFWARALANDVTALLAVLAFTNVPPVLAHSGLATTDAVTMAMVCATVFALVRWLERPTPGRSVWLGLAAGLALLAKMSSIVFLPAAGLAVAIAWLSGRNPLTPYLARAIGAGLIMLITLWAGYRFSVGPLARAPATAPPAATAAPAPATAPPSLRRQLSALARLPVWPAPEYIRGIARIRRENQIGRRNYLLGTPITGGRWYFFPVALGVKTPIPFLILTLVGGVTLVGMGRRRPSALVPVLASVAIFATAMAANINIGVRHILPIFPMLSICAGLGILRLWHWRRLGRTGPALGVLLAGWLVVESALAHPDYLPYFNQLAGDHPEEVLVDSDLDWGQDLGRLVDTARARGISHLWLTYHGKADLSTVGLPPYTELPEYTRERGWIAASVFRMQLGYQGGRFDPFGWLKRYTPVARVGHSIYLYYIDPDSAAPAAAPLRQ